MSTSETFEFQSDISSLLNLIINTFYSNKEIAIRELLANSSDALNKFTNYCIVHKPSNVDHDLAIKIIPDKDTQSIYIVDNGIGMCKSDLKNYLGTIAKSNTKEFLEKFKNNDVIGQFGVGFYSSFLIADKVSVITKHHDDGFYKWESTASGGYTITALEPDEGTNSIKIHDEYTLKQGTVIRCHLKDTCKEFLSESRIKNIVKTHATYIVSPIYLLTERIQTREVDDTDGAADVDGADDGAAADGADDADGADGADDADDAAKAESKTDVEKMEEGDIVIEDISDEKVVEEEAKETKIEKPKKTITETIYEYVLLNDQKPIWCRRAEDVSLDDVHNLYKSFSASNQTPYSYKLIKGEGQVQYNGLLFLPKKLTNNVFERGVRQNNIKLYVRKIFVSDNSADLCPEWLHFVTGIIDTIDLPLNISREMLQENKVVRILRKAIVKKSIDMLRGCMNDMKTYRQIYRTYQKNFKLGVYEEAGDRERVADLLMYPSMHNPSMDRMITYDDYITNMPDEQKEIYYLTGEDIKVMQASPFLERFKEKGYDVLFYNDPIDEYIMQRLPRYKDKKLVCITKGDLEFSGDDKEVLKKVQEEYKPFCDHIKKLYAASFTEVKVSNRIKSTPCVVSAPEYGFTSNMERIVKSQTLGADTSHTYSMMNKRLLEINPEHSLVKRLNSMYNDEKLSSQCNDLLDIMINGALLHSGYNVLQPAQFSEKLMKIVLAGLDIDDDADVDADVDADANTCANIDANADVERITVTDLQMVE